MVITTTAIGFILLGLGLTFCGWRFLKAFQKIGGLKSGSRIGFLLTLFLFGFAFQTGVILGFGTLFTAPDPKGILLVFIFANLFLTFLAMLGIYTAYYIFLPRKSPMTLMIIAFLIGVVTFVFTLMYPPQPFVAASGGIEWGISFPLSLLVFYLLLFGICAQLYIFGRLFFQEKTSEIKILSFVLTLLAFGGIIDQFVRFILLHGAADDIRTRIYDITTAVIGMTFIVYFVFFPLFRSYRSTKSRDSRFNQFSQKI